MVGEEFDIKKLPLKWRKFCRRGKYPIRAQVKSVLRGMRENGEVYCCLTGIRLDPTLSHTHPLYPSHDHMGDRNDHYNMQITTRFANDSKSNLTTADYVRHCEGVVAYFMTMGFIPTRKPCRLSIDWRPNSGGY